MTGTNSASQAVADAANQAVDQMSGDGVVDMTPTQIADLLLPAKEAPPASQAAAEPTKEVPAIIDEPADASKEVDAAKEQSPTPGTPDKEMQKLQQDVSAQSRKLDALLEKKEAGEGLTSAETAAAQQAAGKLSRLRSALEAHKQAQSLPAGDKRREEGSFDLLKHEVDVAETVVDQETRLAKLEKDLAEQREETRRARSQAEQVSMAAREAEIKQTYQGVDVGAVWHKSLADTIELLGIDTTDPSPQAMQMVRHAATKTFHQRCHAAKSSLEAKKEPEAKPAAKKPTTPITPGGAKVASGAGASTVGEVAVNDVNDTATYRRAALGLVRDET